ncbi:MAG: TolB family protein, partial [Planctomycetota bacterium]
ALAVLPLLGGCAIKDVFTKPLAGLGASDDDARGGYPRRRAAAGPAEVRGERVGPPHEERDPVRPETKRQMGFEYRPEEFEQGVYRPDELKNMINSKGFDGLAQQTFTEAGGDFDVDVGAVDGEPTMVYASTRYSRTADVCLQSVRGQAVTVITSDEADDLMPKFSPDGTHVAWCSNRYGNWDLLVSPTRRTERMRPQQLTRSTEDEIHPVWSPDAAWSAEPANAAGLLAFSRYDSMSGVWRIWVLDVRTRSLSAITEGLFPEFRPVTETTSDGKTVYRILYQKSRKRDIPWYSIWTIDVTLDDTGKVEVANAPSEILSNDQWAAINPTWSPDGRYIAFASVRKSPGAQWEARIYRADDIWVVRIDGTDLTQITSHMAPDWSPCWARDTGRGNGGAGRLYFNSLRNGHENVWSVSPVIAGMVR